MRVWMFKNHQTLDTVSYRGLRCFCFTGEKCWFTHPFEAFETFQISFIYWNILIITLGSTYCFYAVLAQSVLVTFFICTWKVVGMKTWNQELEDRLSNLVCMEEELELFKLRPKLGLKYLILSSVQHNSWF